MTTIPVPISASRLTFLHALTGEWVKLRSLKSTWWFLGLIIVVVTLLNVALFALFPVPQDASADTLAVDSTMKMAGQVDILIGVIMATLSITSEFSSGSILPSLNAVPRRGLLLAAKATLLALVIFVSTAIGTALSVLLGDAILSARGHTQVWTSADGRILVGGCLYVTAVALLAFFLGVLVRSSVAVIAVIMALVWIVPPLVGLAGSSGQGVMRLLPSVAGGQVFARTPDTATGGAWGGFSILLAYIVIVAVVAIVAFRKRDI